MLPYHILVLCVILQLAHFLVALQVVQFAAFAAARATITADLDPAQLHAGDSLMAAGASDVEGEKDRARKAALAACSRLEFYGHSGDYLRVKLDNSQIQNQQVLLTVQVAYLVHLPVPFGNYLFYNAMKALGSARDQNYMRAVVLQKCALVRPWE